MSHYQRIQDKLEQAERGRNRQVHLGVGIRNRRRFSKWCKAYGRWYALVHGARRQHIVDKVTEWMRED